MDKDCKNKNGCAFGRITREKVDNFIQMFNDFKNYDFKSLADKVKQIGHRPTWITSTIIWVLSSLVVGLLVRAVMLGL